MVGCIHSLWIVSLTWSLNEETSLSKMLKHVTSQASLHLAFCAKCLKMLEGWVFFMQMLMDPGVKMSRGLTHVAGITASKISQNRENFPKQGNFQF